MALAVFNSLMFGRLYITVVLLQWRRDCFMFVLNAQIGRIKLFMRSFTMRKKANTKYTAYSRVLSDHYCTEIQDRNTASLNGQQSTVRFHSV